MNSKRALEILKEEVIPNSGYLDYEEYGSYENEMLENYNIIKQDLDKLESLERFKKRLLEDTNKLYNENQKLKKVIDILRRKILIVKTPNGIEFRIYEKITQQEYMILIEVLHND